MAFPFGLPVRLPGEMTDGYLLNVIDFRAVEAFFLCQVSTCERL